MAAEHPALERSEQAAELSGLGGGSALRSHVRRQSGPEGAAEELPSRALRRATEYLRTLGLNDAFLVETIASRVAEETHVEDEELHARQAVQELQEQVERWRDDVFAPYGGPPEPLWLRTFLAARPEVFLGPAGAARAAADEFGDPRRGLLPQRAHFKQQSLERGALPTWLLGLLPPLLATLVVCVVIGRAVFAQGFGELGLLWLATFAFLFFNAASGLSTALLGCFTPRRPPQAIAPNAEAPGTVAGLPAAVAGLPAAVAGLPAAVAGLPAAAAGLPRSAIIIPIYHERPDQVFAGVWAMRESLLAIQGGEAFEIFVLSDSRDAGVAAEEERAFRRVAALAENRVPVFYRRRLRNERQKAGNLAEFFERWGDRYRYAVVLDADSLMAGGTLVELLRRMERSPKLALLQAPIRLQGGSTLFARATQFASSTYGRLHERGLSRWAGVHGNYYGHNAVLRVSAFLESCALPVLRGEPPLGGHILSHDFVEAALLCRAGWQVELAHDLGSSYEGVPPTFIDYVARDRRWCQGNLQHLRIIRARGLVPMSRIHLGLGAAAYLAGGVWVAFLLLGVLLWRSAGQAFFGVAVPAALGTLGLLLGPRLLSVLDLVSDRQRRRAHGGLFRLFAGFVFELTLSTVLSPLLMLHHAGMVLQIVTGRAVGWRAQRRDASASFLDTLRVEAVPMLLGIAFAGALWLYARALLPWLAPVWVPWVLAAPLAWFCSLEATGRLAQRLGLLLVPSEIEPEEIILRANELSVLTRGDASARFRDLVLDPVLLEAHIARLPAPAAGVVPAKLDDLCARALRLGPAALSQKERERLSADPASMRRLHREAWQCWPVESWQPARHRPHLPSEPDASCVVGPEARGLRSV